MRLHLIVAIVQLGWALVAGGEAQAGPYLDVYAHDSWVSKHAIGPQIQDAFEKKCHCKINWIRVGDAGQILTRIELDERVAAGASSRVAVGVDQILYQRLKSRIEPWGDWKPEGWAHLAKEVAADTRPGFLPVDYGVFAWIWDRDQLPPGSSPPQSLAELRGASWKRKILLEDPRTSTPGLAFLMETATRFQPQEFKSFWHSFRNQWLTLAPGWDTAYGLFLDRRAPLVWSYSTSQAYHQAHPKQGETPGRYQAAFTDQRQPMQIEGAVILQSKSGAVSPLARLFLEYLLSEEVQKLIPEAQWMMPARREVALPVSFQGLPHPSRPVALEASPDQVKATLKRWEEAIQ